jgi:hypothetical protein
MENLPDDPIVSSMLRTGYPPWIDTGWEDDEEWEDDPDDVFFGNQTESF